ncbi:MAG TPA: hypothetical protein VNF28_06515 [Candidatus Binataceae bacterium]|nr:hypothetical protein [Candidatus Binataceae bacterium]
MKQSACWRRPHAGLLCAVGICLTYLAFFPAAIYPVDGNSMLAVSESLITGHGFTVPIAGLGVVGRHGMYYSSWYPLLSIVALPQVAAGVFVSRHLGLPQHYTAAIFALTLSPILAAATALLVAMLARRLGATTRGAIVASLGYAFGTIAMVYSRDFFADPLLALLTVAGIYFSLGDGPREAGAAAAAAMLAVLAKPTGIVLGPCLGAYLLCRRRPVRRWIAPPCASLAGLLIYFAYNWARFANPFDFGQPGAFALSVIPSAIAGFLISPGRGVLWYCPPIIALAAVRGANFRRWESALIVAAAGAYLAEHSVWTFWTGGWSWGPRLLLPALPGLMALAGLVERRRRWLLVALSVAGFIINSPNLGCFYARYYQEAIAAKVSVRAQQWSVTAAPLFQIWGAAWRETIDAYRNADQVGVFVHQAGNAPLATSVESSRALRIVNLWWWMLPAVGIPRIAGAAVSLALLIAGLWLIARALARAPDDDGAALAAGPSAP